MAPNFWKSDPAVEHASPSFQAMTLNEDRFGKWVKNKLGYGIQEFMASELHPDIAKQNLENALIACSESKVKAWKAARKMMKFRS